ncbi:MAG: helix-turn-helix domain-containing protein [Clostridiales bacterium]|nr:helix-turn-helix domain-containing protein [Clostridiales bacterium]
MNFGDKIRSARLTLNLSQAELAAATGISERSLYTYEQLGTIPRKSNVMKLAEALHVTSAYLLDDDINDPGQELEEEAFILEARARYGNKGADEARDILNRAGALFAGGDLDEEAKEVFMQSLMKVYLSSKEKASEKFSPGSRKKKSRPSL